MKIVLQERIHKHLPVCVCVYMFHEQAICGSGYTMVVNMVLQFLAGSETIYRLFKKRLKMGIWTVM